jgi:hypothetical protein
MVAPVLSLNTSLLFPVAKVDGAEINVREKAAAAAVVVVVVWWWDDEMTRMGISGPAVELPEIERERDENGTHLVQTVILIWVLSSW